MTTGLVLVLAILVLGGVIATVGDRLGTRVGKARLTWFNLRPRKTATLITILTGAIISASTLGILFALSENLRRGVFDFEKVNQQRREAEDKLAAAQAEIGAIQERLERARDRQRQVRRQLTRINQELQTAIKRQAITQGKLNTAQAQLGQIQSRFQAAQQLLGNVSQQLATLQSDIQQLQRDRQVLTQQRDQVREQIAQRDQQIAQRNQQIAQRDQQVAQRDQQIKDREAQLKNLENQRITLAQEVNSLSDQVNSLGEQLQDLRLGRVTLLRNQPLASGVLRVVNPNAAPGAVNNVLWQANRFALQRLRPDTRDFSRQILRITTGQVEQLAQQIQDGKEYVVRVLSSGNYVLGEPCVLASSQCIDVVLTALENKLVFPQNSVVATIAIDPKTMTNDEIAEQLRRVIAAAQFRARQAGILGDQIEIANNNLESIAQFFERIKQYNQPLEIQIISFNNAYPAGNAELELIAVQNNQVLFGTQ